ncbi:HET-domain-containing protein [Amniculicola lignicola CBS 123094]|uniref:HET-domain-containing protein n=1 Tax=Amniculicola lignicola CBS 123094 TaxID=1392246 RepID=A0A6A5WCI6_9PLEO|nr:HET-domain-containing protein [Amniculicola lignicola CBS 123094]
MGRTLCSTCAAFDVRALVLSAAAQLPKTPSTTYTLRSGLPKYFEHLPNLLSLKASALDCHLCEAIWRSYCDKADARQLSDEVLKEGFGSEPIWIGTTPYNSDLHALPHVMVSQTSSTGQMRILAYFEVCAKRGGGPSDSRYLLADSIFPYSGSPECLGLCRSWLEDCCSQHVTCKQLNVALNVLPTRVIDVEAEDDKGNARPRLVDGQGRTEKFAALSYCWGGERILCLTTTTQDDLRAGLPLDRFPGTLRDAIVVTHHLGLRYLWIDALCIQQDSTEDWNREAMKMRDVYKGAVVTIAAASSSKSSDGIFRHRGFSAAHCEIPWPNGDTPQPTVFLRPGSEIWDDPARSSLMHTRGWTLQESLLAPRTIYLGAQLVTWECANGQKDEAGRALKATENYRSKSHIQIMYADIRLKQLYKALRAMHLPPVVRAYTPSLSLESLRQSLQGYPRHGLRSFLRILRPWGFFTQGLLQAPGGNQLTYYDLWREIIMQYSTRRLTNATDTLPALSGLADDFHHITGDDYIAGMWLGDFMRSLCYTLILEKDPSSEAQEYLAPSWSWAALHGYQVTFYGGDSEATHFNPIARIIDMKVVTPEGGDPFSKVIDGYLILKAPFLTVDDPYQIISEDTKNPGFMDRIQSDITKSHEWKHKHIPHKGQCFALAKVASYKTWQIEETGMMLFLETCEENGDTWRRVGFVSVRMYDNATNIQEEERFEVMRAQEWKTGPWVKRTICVI